MCTGGEAEYACRRVFVLAGRMVADYLTGAHPADMFEHNAAVSQWLLECEKWAAEKLDGDLPQMPDGMEIPRFPWSI